MHQFSPLTEIIKIGLLCSLLFPFATHRLLAEITESFRFNYNILFRLFVNHFSQRKIEIENSVQSCNGQEKNDFPQDVPLLAAFA